MKKTIIATAVALLAFTLAHAATSTPVPGCIPTNGGTNGGCVPN